MRIRAVQNPTFLLTSGDLDSDSNALEVLDDAETAIFEIRASAPGQHVLVLYGTTELISVPVSAIEEAIQLARQKVWLTPLPDEESGQR